MPAIPMGDGGCGSAKGRVFCSGGGPGLGISQRPSLLVLEDRIRVPIEPVHALSTGRLDPKITYCRIG